MDTIKTTTSAMLPHSAAPLPGYESLRYLLDALAKRAARAAGVPKTDVPRKLLRYEYAHMPLPQRAALCHVAHLAFNDRTRIIPNTEPFDTTCAAEDTVSWGARYLIWFDAIKGQAAKRTGVAKMEIVTYPFLAMYLYILFDDASHTEAPYILSLPTNWCKAVDMLANTWPRVELLTPGQFDAMVEGWRLAHEQKAGA